MNFLIPLALAVPLQAAPDTPLPELSHDTLDQWQAYIRPSADERRWQEVPWRNSFWQGVLDARAEGKPVLLWTMNGHPMGCT